MSRTSDSGNMRRMLPAQIVALVLAPMTVVGASVLGARSYYLASILIIIFAMAPFFISFEQTRPRAREIVLIASMCVIAIASRIAFIWIPFVKPVGAFIVIAGIAFGSRSGFIVGALTMFASNFIFGQGPWTPWQMLAFGLLGFLAGIAADLGAIPKCRFRNRTRIIVSAAIWIAMTFITGPILDTASLFLFLTEITPASAIAIYGAGLIPNILQATGASLTFLLIGNAMLGKLNRVCVKTGAFR